MTKLHIYENNGVILFNGAYNIDVEIISFDDKKITYQVTNVPLHTYDQHSRARIGVRFFDVEYSKRPVYSLYTEVFNKLINDEIALTQTIIAFEELEKLRNQTEYQEDYNLMSRNVSYKVEQDYSSLKGQMMRRLKLCEEEQIVALHWILRDEMIKKGIKIAETFAPGCDITGECDYIAVSDHLSNAFGALFDACGRWDYDKSVYRSFNKSCTTPDLIKEQTGIDIFRSKYEIENNLR